MAEKLKLFRYVHWAVEENGEEVRYVDWLFGEKEEDIINHGQMYEDKVRYEFREATEEECDAWADGWEEARAVTQAEERHSHWNGVAYKLISHEPFKTEKIFRCGKCDKESNFVDASKVGEFHLALLKPADKGLNREETLWHICQECAGQSGD